MIRPDAAGARWLPAPWWAALAALVLTLAPVAVKAGEGAAEAGEGAAPQPEAAAEPKEPAPMEFESYQLVILERGPRAEEYSGEALEKIQAQHLAHLTKMRESGKMLVAGPFSDQPDERLRGMCLYQVASVEEARSLAEADPAVKAGRVKVTVMTWWTRKGAVVFPASE